MNVAHAYQALILVLIASLCLFVGGNQPARQFAEAVFVALSLGFDFFLFVYFGLLASREFSQSDQALGICEATINLGLALGCLGGFVAVKADITLHNLIPIYLGLVFVASLALALIAEQRFNIERTTAPSSLQDSCDELKRMYGLTPREREIIELLGQGRSVPFIADMLFLAKSTVETHRKSIYKKLGIHNRQELLNLLGESAKRSNNDQ